MMNQTLDNYTPTPHNAAHIGDIAETVIMPGDPLRAKFIAESFLENAVQYNNIRGMNGYTGTYKGRRVSVQGHGMGIPSVGIYTYELYNFYGVNRIIRVGSSGAIQLDIKLGDIVVAMGACTDSAYASQFDLPGTFAPIASFSLLEQCVDAAKNQNLQIHVGNVLSSDVFYSDNPKSWKKWADMGVLSIEMESMGLYCNAAKAGKEALCITTVSDQILTGEKASSEQRQTGFSAMIQLALDMINA